MKKPTTIDELLKLTAAERKRLGVTLTASGLALLKSLSVCPSCDRRVAAIQKAKAEGRLGPKSTRTDAKTSEKARKLRAKGLSYRAIAAELSISRQTAFRHCQPDAGTSR
ncbi:hypothetical protein [Planctomycetes bacterium TBK1r]|uniref:Helix-turn-helix domain of resolvase n=1 Tax=Stieleria magnilauensis TaxID=2527963 RepID=A0ABX5XLZ0_9BACT|nr:hypothetical protein TBK1r_05800 [Planctomycetes bacterium TBK1r]